MASILETGKDGYDCDAEFDARTRAAVQWLHSEWGAPEKLFERDAVEILDFIRGDYQHVAPILAALGGYRLLDVGCGYGRLMPLLSAFRCRGYLGIDRCQERIRSARIRWGAGPSFLVSDVLSTRPELAAERAHVVWTSNVLQHLLLPDKKALVNTMKHCRAPGGICLLREEEIHPMSLAWCEKRYAGAGQPKHMIPVPEDLVRSWFAPLEFRKVGGNVWIAKSPDEPGPSGSEGSVTSGGDVTA